MNIIIIKKLINKKFILENENKKDIEFIEINNKYLNILEDFNNLNKKLFSIGKRLM